MAIGDYVYLLDPQSGDTSPHNELNGAQTITGGTTTLTDRGGGDYAWEFSGGVSSGALDSASRATTTTGNGWVQALTIKVTTYPTVEFQPIVGIGNNSDLNSGGTFFGRNGSGNLRTRIGGNQGSLSVGASGATDEYTWVQRVRTNASGSAEGNEVWRGGLAHSGDLPDFTNFTGTIASSQTLDIISVMASNSCVVQVKNWAVWYEELSDADCVAIADDFRGTLGLDGGGGGGQPVRTNHIFNLMRRG